jgi:hypothetical protein
MGHEVVSAGWRKISAVLAIVLAPLAGAIILVAAGVLAIAGWQRLHGIPVALPANAALWIVGLCRRQLDRHGGGVVLVTEQGHAP